MRYSKFIWKFLSAILLPACCIAAQTERAEADFQVVCEFPTSSNTAPLTPNSALVEIGNGNFYGTTSVGGTNNNGTVFEVATSGILTRVFAFNGFDGSFPRAITLGSNGDLYGLTAGPVGQNVYGSIFEVATNGVFKSLKTNGNFTAFFLFGGTNGSNPAGRLNLDNDGNFYGATLNGGNGFNAFQSSSGNGTVFQITTNGALTVLWQFNGTNGSQPVGLTLGNDGNFYGTTAYGGSNYTGVNTGNGTVFQITTNGVLTTLAFFTGTNGSNPMSGLAQGSDGNFYGTTYSGGTFNLGTVFQITTNGNLTVLLSFDGTNSSKPFGGLTQGSDGNFYGTTAFSAPNGTNYGTIFRITTNGRLTTLIYLNGTNGLHPFTDMILGHDGNLYGAMDDVAGHQLLDGSWGNIFRLVQRPVVAVASQNGGAILSWTSFTNQIYRVEYKSSLTDAIWVPLITNTASGNTTFFTNSFSNATQRFYRVVLP